MRIVCAWCLKEGKPALIGEKEPLDDATEGHGLCPDHRRVVEEEIAEYRRLMKQLQDKVDP